MWTNPATPPPSMWTPRHSISHSRSGMSPLSPISPATTPVSASVPVYKLKNQGRRIGQVIKLKPECYEKYKECHAKIWPEVLMQIKNCGIEDYSIFHDSSSNLLFATFKYTGYDYAGDMERMRENPKVQEWWRMTDSYQESLVPGAKSSVAGEPSWWKPVEEVFYAP